MSTEITDIRNDPKALARVAEIYEHQRDILAQDLETALNICRSYQQAMVMLGVNDPNWVKIRDLLVKYRMPFTDPEGHTTGQVFVNGHDITVHPDSIEGTTVEVEELPPGGEPKQIEGQTTIDDFLEDDDGS